MKCPVCSNNNSSVVDSRPTEGGFVIRRRRQCDKCNYRFTTAEEVEILDLMIVKRDGQRESYMREKLINGIKKSLTKRAYTQEKLNHLINNIERDLQKKKKREVDSQNLGEIIMKRLKAFDKVAYIRFASVYRDFKDVSSFTRELNKIAAKNKK